ncbi:hypothetical protein BC629DRAFT_1601125 [Irpex lacteus]|nr:hypothetical protein BC629DRAFT_1601125 [Irpex lacteus]
MGSGHEFGISKATTMPVNAGPATLPLNRLRRELLDRHDVVCAPQVARDVPTLPPTFGAVSDQPSPILLVWHIVSHRLFNRNHHHPQLDELPIAQASNPYSLINPSRAIVFTSRARYLPRRRLSSYDLERLLALTVRPLASVNCAFPSPGAETVGVEFLSPPEPKVAFLAVEPTERCVRSWIRADFVDVGHRADTRSLPFCADTWIPFPEPTGT